MKIRDFYVGLPFFALDLAKSEEAKWIAPVVLGMLGLGFFWEKIRGKFKIFEALQRSEVSLEKKLEKRQKELRLISRRVREIYVEETRKNGLLITEAYYGSKSLIDRLLAEPGLERFRYLPQAEFSTGVIDVTDSLRFYIDSSKLYLPKGERTELYGVYDLNLAKGEVPYFHIK